jgi:hypothetical protein
MEFLNKNKKMLVIGAAVLSLICTALSYMGDFIQINKHGIFFFWDIYNVEHWIELRIQPHNLIPVFLIYLPVVLLALYGFLFMGKKEGKFALPIVMLSAAAAPAYYLFFHILNNWLHIYFIDIQIHLSTMYFILYFLTAAALTVGALLTFYKPLRKLVLIAVPAVAILFELIMFTDYFEAFEFYLDYELYIALLTWPLSTLAVNLLYIGLILLGLTDGDPQVAVIAADGSAADLNGLPPEQALKALDKQYEKGVITFEEYKAKRLEIIQKI